MSISTLGSGEILKDLRFRFLLWYGIVVPYHRGKWKVHDLLRRALRVERINSECEVHREELVWSLNPGDYVHRDLFWLGAKDPWEILHISKFVRPGAVICDVGANFGYYAIRFAQVLYRRCTVYAFEPDAMNFARLTKNIKLNGLTDIVVGKKMALGDMNGKVSIIHDSGNSGASFIDTGNIVGDADITTLDTFFRVEKLDRVDFVKVDTEGYEARFLIGGTETLAKFRPPMLIELDPPRLERQGSSVSEVLGILHDLRYTILFAKREKLVPIKEATFQAGYINAIAVPN
jgi:FkbM family methyltransferase